MIRETASVTFLLPEKKFKCPYCNKIMNKIEVTLITTVKMVWNETTKMYNVKMLSKDNSKILNPFKTKREGIACINCNAYIFHK